MASDITRMRLGPLDHLPPRHYAHFVFYLPLKPDVSPLVAFDWLQQGLLHTFSCMPWLNGKVFWESPDTPGWRPGQLEIRHTPVNIQGPKPYQLRFNELDFADSYADLKEMGFPADTFEDETIVWAPFVPDLDNGAEVFVAQANFIPGACVLTSAIFHSVTDGMAEVAVFKLWADQCRNLRSAGSSAMTVPSEHSDRSLLDRIWAKERSARLLEEIDPKLWQVVGLDAPMEQPKEQLEVTKTDRLLKSHIFYISPSNFTALKKQCNEELENSQVSGNDAVCGLIWRGLMKCRYAAGDLGIENIAKLEMTLDGRPYLSLPPTYLGNAILLSRSTVPLGDLASTGRSIAHAAQIIRNSANVISPETALDAYTLAASLTDYKSFDKRSTPIEGTSLLISSLLSMPTGTASFGTKIFANGGKPEAVRPLMGAFNRSLRICFVMPPKSHGGIEIVCSLFDDELDLLLEDSEFGRYAMFVS